MTGAVNVNVSIAPLTGSGGTYYMNELALAVQSLGGGKYALINWTTAGSTTNFTERIMSNTTYAMSSLPGLIDFNVGLVLLYLVLRLPQLEHRLRRA